MERKSIGRETKDKPPRGAALSTLPLAEIREQLKALLKERVRENLLAELDQQILSLRLGLDDETCSTLRDTAIRINKSPETIRRRQYLALKRAIKDLRFFKLLRDYASLVDLPRGVTYYLRRYSD